MTGNGAGPGERPRTKLEDEVLEILMKNDKPPSNVVKFQARVQRNRYTLPQLGRARLGALRLTSMTLLFACVVLAILGALVHGGSPLLARIFALGSIAALVALLVQGYIRPRRPRTKRWRGRDIDFSESGGPHWPDRWRGPKGPKR